MNDRLLTAAKAILKWMEDSHDTHTKPVGVGTPFETQPVEFSVVTELRLAIAHAEPLEREFAKVVWVARDLQELRPNWTTAQREDFLGWAENGIAGEMIEHGYNAIRDELQDEIEHPPGRAEDEPQEKPTCDACGCEIDSEPHDKYCPNTDQ